ncbi:hypothetical protein F4814DRAFT_454259 [Daldinia grandis]|nr:hypothetical protein F4814DRAFT_454259 [Daldinia grandis]
MDEQEADDILEMMVQGLREELAIHLADTNLGNSQDPTGEGSGHGESMGVAPGVDGHQGQQDIADDPMTEDLFTGTGPIHSQPVPNTPTTPSYNPTNITAAIHTPIPFSIPSHNPAGITTPFTDTPTSAFNFTYNIGISSQTTIAPPSNPHTGNEDLVFEAAVVASGSNMEDDLMEEDPFVEDSLGEAPLVQGTPQAPAFSSIPTAWLLPSKPRETAKLDLNALKKTLKSNMEGRSKESLMGRGGKQRAFDQAAVKGALLPDTYYTIGSEGLPHKETDKLPFTESDEERLSAIMERLDTASKHNRGEQNEKNLLVAEAEKKLKEGWQKKKNDADFQSLMKLKKRPANPFITPKRPKKPADKK